MFGGHRRFRELLTNSVEGIASNILAARLAKMTAAGLLSRHADPTHRQKVDYRLTEAAIQLVPVLAVLGDRSEEHTSELQSRGHLVCRLLLEKKKSTPDHDHTLDKLTR